jgi:hypothetical protein
MSKVIVGLSTSGDGIASGTGEHDFMTVHEAVLGWVFNLRSWQAAQGMDGGEDTAESRLWGEEFDRIGAQLTGRRMFDFSYPYWGDRRALPGNQGASGQLLSARRRVRAARPGDRRRDAVRVLPRGRGLANPARGGYRPVSTNL